MIPSCNFFTYFAWWRAPANADWYSLARVYIYIYKILFFDRLCILRWNFGSEEWKTSDICILLLLPPAELLVMWKKVVIDNFARAVHAFIREYWFEWLLAVGKQREYRSTCGKVTVSTNSATWDVPKTDWNQLNVCWCEYLWRNFYLETPNYRLSGPWEQNWGFGREKIKTTKHKKYNETRTKTIVAPPGEWNLNEMNHLICV